MNPIKFQVQVKQSQRADHRNSVNVPTDGSEYALVFNDDWNDYGYRISFALWYFPEGRKQCLGELKILHKTAINTFKEIKDGFEGGLSNEFCSLGISTYYYSSLVEELGQDEAKRVLTALRDCIADKQIFEEWHSHPNFDETIARDLMMDRILREVPLILSGLQPEEMFSFDYTFHSPSIPTIGGKWSVELAYQPPSFKRILGIIGENGVGKTRMLADFVRDFFSQQPQGLPQKPMFNGITVISSTSHDRYPKIEEIEYLTGDHGHLPYNSFSLDDLPFNKKQLVSQILSVESRGTIRGKSLLKEFKKSVESCIGKNESSFFEEVTKTITLPNHLGELCEVDYETTTVNPEQLEQTLEILSSGQLYSLAVLTYAFSNIHMGCLLILDEPEVHLHPSVVLSLMLTLTTILHVFQGYAIIATHSPLIVREIVRENVFRMSKFNQQIPVVERVGYDTFGEDISILYQRIFGYDEQKSLFSHTVKSLKKHNYRIDIDRICEIMGTDGKINLNARLRIASIISQEE